MSECLKPYYNRRLELSIEGGCLLWGMRVIIPSRLQDAILKDLHRDHPGIVRMKSFARSHVWWPGLDKSLEQLANACQSCLAAKPSKLSVPLHPWVWPTKPWRRLHVDFAGPFMGKSYLLVVDAHSKWPEIVEMNTTTSERTIAVLRRLFAQFGLPEQVVSDNGPQFTSEDFKLFMQSNGIKHLRSTPYHPASNGAVERLVRSFKEAMKAGRHDKLSPCHRLQNFLLNYRSTVHATTGESPASLFLGRQIRTRFDLLHPNLEERVSHKQAAQKRCHDQRSHVCEFSAGDRVLVKDKSDWVQGTIIQHLGPISYLVKLSDGCTYRVNEADTRE